MANAVRDRVGQLQTTRKQNVISDAAPADLNHEHIWKLVYGVTIAPGTLAVQLDKATTCANFECAAIDDPDKLTITIPFTERKRGVEMKLAIEGTTTLDETFLANIALANKWYGQIKQGKSFDEIAAAAQTSKRRVQNLVRFAFLAPKIVQQVTLGTQPVGFTTDWLTRHPLPLDWDTQQERISGL